MRRRELLTGTGLALGTAVAGCSTVLGDLTFVADTARVAESVSDDTGYELAETTTRTVERTIEVAGQSRDVEVTNELAEYEKQVDLGPLGERRAAIFTVLSTPQISVLGQTFNPVGEMSVAELADRIQSQYDGIYDLERDGEGSVTILGTETTQTRFSGEVEVAAGRRIDAFVHLSEPVADGDDFVVAVGAYPQRLPDEERNILRMMSGIRHSSS